MIVKHVSDMTQAELKELLLKTREQGRREAIDDARGESAWIKKLRHGLYIIHWRESGGTSLAAVGSDESGRRWFAPTNWIFRKDHGPSFDWSMVERVERIEPTK